MQDSGLIEGVKWLRPFSLDWQPLEDLPAGSVDAWMGANLVLLGGIAAQEVSRHETDHDPNNAKMLERIEAKLDLSLHLLGRLLAQRASLPPPRPALLACTGIEWMEDHPAEAGSSILMSLYLLNEIPEALVLPARILACSGAAGQFQITAQFTPLASAVEDNLERIIFRQHRREIQARQQARSQR